MQHDNSTPADTIEQVAGYPVHPAANLFPRMAEEEFAGLVADIKENGQREPGTIWNGQLIDGRHRGLACEKLGIRFDCQELDPETDPIKWVLSHNLHRRHLRASQLAIIAAKTRDLYNEMARERMMAGKAADPPVNLPEGIKGDSRDLAGAAVGVSGSLVDHASTVLKEGSPELVAAVEKGEVAVSKAAKVAKTTPKAKQLAKAKAKPKKGKVASLYVCQACGKQYGDGTTECDCAKGDAYEPPAAEVAEDEADTQRLDGWGIPIQPHAREAFEAVAIFEEILLLLGKADRLYSKVAEMPGGKYLQRPGVSINSRDRWKNKGIKDAISAVIDCTPTYTVCPYEYHAAAHPDSQHKHDENCALCKGLNWSRELGKNEIDPAVVAKIKEAFGV